MVAGSFRVAQRLTLKGAAQRISRDLGQGVLVLEELATGRYSEHKLADLLDHWNKGELIIGEKPLPSSALHEAIDRAHADAFQQSYSAEQQENARKKLVFVERLENVPRTSALATPIIKEIWSDKRIWKSVEGFLKAPHFTTVAKWIRTYRNAERDIRSLIDRHLAKGNRNPRVDPIVAVWIDDSIEARYLTLERPTLKSIHKEIKGLIAERNATRLPSERLQVPSYAHLKQRVSELAPYDVCRARYGARVADLKFRVAGMYRGSDRPLGRASMDHCRLDLFVVDEESGLPLGRPWLTVIIDDKTRYILGYYLSFEEPSAVSMTRALKHALSPKEESEDAKSEWDAWGIMEILAVDNGMEFHGKALEAGAGRYGITVLFCPRRKPWYKGKIERFFGSLNTGLLADIQGKTFSNITLKGDYDPSKHAVLTLATVRRIVHMWIVDVYHNEEHRSLKTAPAQAWKDEIESVDRYLPPSSISLDAAFSSSSTRKLTHKGIEHDGLFYNCRELGVLRELHGSEIVVEIRTWDEDLGAMLVVAPDGSTVISVPAVDTEYALGLTRWQHRVCKRYRRRLQEDDGREIGLLEARRRIRELIQQDMQLTSRKSRKKQSRFVQNDYESDEFPAEPESKKFPPPEGAPSENAVPEEVAPAEKASTDDSEKFDAESPSAAIPKFSSRNSTQGVSV